MGTFWQNLLEDKKKLAALIGGIVVVCGLGGYGYQKYQAQKAARQLTLYGNVDVREVAVAFRQSDRIAEELVEEGDKVTKGQVLARLDTDELKIKKSKLQAQIAAQQSVVDKLHNGTRAEDLEAARAKADEAAAQADQARQDLARVENAFSSSHGRSVSRQDRDAAQTKVDVTAAQAEAAQQEYEKAQAGPRDEDVKSGEAQLKALQEDMKHVDYLLSQSELKAPADGVIRSRLLEVGDMASPQKPVFKLSLNDKKWVRVYVSEKDLGRIYEGMKAKVYTDSHPKDPIEGQIGYISSTAEFTPKTVQTTELRTSLLYEVRVYVTDPNNVLRMGMPATVKIDTEQSHD